MVVTTVMYGSGKWVTVLLDEVVGCAIEDGDMVSVTGSVETIVVGWATGVGVTVAGCVLFITAEARGISDEEFTVVLVAVGLATGVAVVWAGVGLSEALATGVPDNSAAAESAAGDAVGVVCAFCVPATAVFTVGEALGGFDVPPGSEFCPGAAVGDVFAAGVGVPSAWGLVGDALGLGADVAAVVAADVGSAVAAAVVATGAEALGVLVLDDSAPEVVLGDAAGVAAAVVGLGAALGEGAAIVGFDAVLDDPAGAGAVVAAVVGAAVAAVVGAVDTLLVDADGELVAGATVETVVGFVDGLAVVEEAAGVEAAGGSVGAELAEAVGVGPSARTGDVVIRLPKNNIPSRMRTWTSRAALRVIVSLPGNRR